jgi:hypothetical protein
MLDRASSAAARARRHRTREKRGEVVLRLPVVEHQVAEALLAFGRLDERAALDRGRVERALAAVLEQWAVRWIKQELASDV